jgi:lipopolysaccharide transport system permease protein
MTPIRSFDTLRLGWPAALLDLFIAGACLVAAYRFRFGGPDFTHFLSVAGPVLPGIVGLHLTALALMGVYRPHGLRLWPVRLTAGTMLGVLLPAVLLMVASASLEGVSRQAVAVYAVLFVISAMGWRAAVGLVARRRRERLATVTEHGLEVRGAQYQSLGGGLVLAWRYRHLLRNLVARDLKLKYRGSVLGFLWSLLNPLVMIAVYTFAFTYVLNVRTPRYASFVLIGIVTWGFFAGTMQGSTMSITASGNLLHSVLFPRVILPIAGVLFNLAQFLLTITVFLPVLFLAYQVIPGPQTLLFPIFLVLQVLFITGAALVLSTATTYFRDVQHLLEVGLNVAFWATPILYEYTLVPERFRFAMLLSPMAPFIRAYQDIFHYQVWPDWSVCLLATAYGIGMFVAGLSVFVTYEDMLAEQV